MRTPYFELGDLKLVYEYTLMEYDNIPLLFTCTNNYDRYLCICNCINDGFRWIATKCSTKILKSLVDQKISIRNAFKESKYPYYLITGEYNGEIKYRKEDYDTLASDNEFPEPGFMLDDDFVEEDIKEQIIGLLDNITARYHILSQFRVKVEDISFSNIGMTELSNKATETNYPITEKETFLYRNIDKLRNVNSTDINKANIAYTTNTFDELAA